jgi:hypothetical protein
MCTILPADVQSFVKIYRYISEDNYAEFLVNRNWDTESSSKASRGCAKKWDDLCLFAWRLHRNICKQNSFIKWRSFSSTFIWQQSSTYVFVASDRNNRIVIKDELGKIWEEQLLRGMWEQIYKDYVYIGKWNYILNNMTEKITQRASQFVLLAKYY